MEASRIGSIFWYLLFASHCTYSTVFAKIDYQTKLPLQQIYSEHRKRFTVVPIFNIRHHVTSNLEQLAKRLIPSAFANIGWMHINSTVRRTSGAHKETFIACDLILKSF